MIFADVLATVRSRAYPEGLPRNLKPIFAQALVQGAVDLQRYVPRLKRRQFTTVKSAVTVFQSGITVVQRPASNAKIKRIYTYISADHRDAFYYTPVTRQKIEELAADRSRRTGSAALPTINVNDGDVRSVAGRGQVMHTASLNKGFRSNQGVFAVVDDQVWLYPSIESSERVSIEWTGVKYEFTENDLVTWDSSVIYALALWVRKEGALFETGDATARRMFADEYVSLRRSMAAEDNDADHAASDAPEALTPYQVLMTDAETGYLLEDDMTPNTIYADANAVRAAVIPNHVMMIHIETVDGGSLPSAFYKRRPLDNSNDDGVNYVHDSEGNVFQRLN